MTIAIVVTITAAVTGFVLGRMIEDYKNARKEYTNNIALMQENVELHKELQDLYSELSARLTEITELRKATREHLFTVEMLLGEMSK